MLAEPELVVDEPEPEAEEDVLLDDWEVEEEVLVDLRLAELNVPLPAEEPVPDKPEGTMPGATAVAFAPAGTVAAADWAVATAGCVVTGSG